jgi:hypothetical protein
MAGNYDITDIFCDATFKICGSDIDSFSEMINRLDRALDDLGPTITFNVSCEPEALPANLQSLIIQ